MEHNDYASVFSQENPRYTENTIKELFKTPIHIGNNLLDVIIPVKHNNQLNFVTTVSNSNFNTLLEILKNSNYVKNITNTRFVVATITTTDFISQNSTNLIFVKDVHTNKKSCMFKTSYMRPDDMQLYANIIFALNRFSNILI